MTTIIESTPNKTLLLTSNSLFDGPEDCIVLQIEDRWGNQINPDIEATESTQERIDAQLNAAHTTGASSEGSPCVHGVPKRLCTVCPSFQGGDRYA